jgi:iron(III) transport system permease protein
VSTCARAQSALFASLPLVVLFGGAAWPLFFLARGFAAQPSLDLSSLAQTLMFAAGGAAVSTIAGGVAGALAGTLDTPGRRWALGLSAVLLAAPPAFWWIGVTRLPVGLGGLSGPTSGAIVAGLALAPVSLLLVFAAAREMPPNVYQAARVSLPPTRRFFFVLIPLLRLALIAGFLLTVILLLGESEIPFLFGFRTAMTDVVTIFSQTFDPGRTVPVILPLVVTVLVIGLLMAKPLFTTVLSSPRSGRGVVRSRAGRLVGLGMIVLPLLVALSLGGYGWAAVSGAVNGWRRLPLTLSTVAVSIAEPVACALASVALAVLAAYPARRSPAIHSLVLMGLLLFCVPAAVFAIGWIGVGQALGGVAMPPSVAHVSRTIGLPALGFLIAYSRLPRSLEDAARLVRVSAVRRAWTFVLPLLMPSLVATAALVASLVYADRDVASLLLSPGASRLMLNLYLLSANAPSSAIGATALVVFVVGALVIALACAVPLVLWRRPRE